MQKIAAAPLGRRKQNLALYAGSFLLSGLLLGIVLAVLDIAPFGENSLAVVDANIQYLDFFAYFKDVLQGENSIFYSFSKTFGGNTLGLFSYYLSSPLNLLVVFFGKDQLHIFFTLLVVLKISLCGLTASIFFRNRFGALRPIYVLFLSLGYALMQYNLVQNSNIMWLDGVYLLPLLLLGVWRLLQGKGRPLLIAAVACSLLFNWYSAGINCLFSAIHFLYELLLQEPAPFRRFKACLLHIWRYAYCMLLGLGCSLCLFLPTLLALGNGRGSADTSAFSLDFIGNVFSTVQNFTLGAVESQGSASFFCGSLALLGCIGFFFARRIPRRVKVITGAALGVTLLLFYWQPLVLLFSLLKSVYSYWYRYSYVGIFMLLTVAARFFTVWPEEKKDFGLPGKCAAGFVVLLLLLDFAHSAYSPTATYFTVILCLCTAGALLLCRLCRQRNRRYRLAALLLAAVVCGEAGLNSYLVLRQFSLDASDYAGYVENQQAQIAELQAHDDSFYRISQTSTRVMNEGTNLTANYNEAFAFSYASISGYTSVSDNNQRQFLDKLGYASINLDTMNVVNTSIVSADSLLGVKYLLSDYPIAGLERVESLPSRNGKAVYANPYCLPMAFAYPDGGDTFQSDETNPFLYQNALYSYLLGRQVEIFKPMTVKRQADAEGVVYTLSLPDTAAALYGYIDTSRALEASLYVDGQLQTGYSMWKAPRVFYIPQPEQPEGTVTVRLEAQDPADGITEEAFYYLDLKVLQEACDTLSAKAAQDLTISADSLSCRVEADAGERLYLSVPADDGWTVTVNGQEVQADSVDGCMMTLPLEEGENQIQLRYTVPGLYAGIALSGGSLVVCALLFVFTRLRKKRDAA